MWPLPALIAWSLSWACYLILGALGLTDALAFLGGTLFSVLLSNLGTTLWRRCLIVIVLILGFYIPPFLNDVLKEAAGLVGG